MHGVTWRSCYDSSPTICDPKTSNSFLEIVSSDDKVGHFIIINSNDQLCDSSPFQVIFTSIENGNHNSCQIQANSVLSCTIRINLCFVYCFLNGPSQNYWILNDKKTPTNKYSNDTNMSKHTLFIFHHNLNLNVAVHGRRNVFRENRFIFIWL